MVQGKRKPVCLVNGNLGEIIPLNRITQEMMDIAKIFSLTTLNFKKSNPINKERIVHIRKIDMLKIVVIRRTCILISLVVKEVNNAKFRYNMIIDKSKHIAIDKIEIISFLIVRARIKDKKDREMIILLFLYASLISFSFLLFSANIWFNLSSFFDKDSSFKLVSFKSNN